MAWAIRPIGFPGSSCAFEDNCIDSLLACAAGGRKGFFSNYHKFCRKSYVSRLWVSTSAPRPGARGPLSFPGMDTGISVTHLQPDTTERFVSLRRELGVSTFGLNQIVLQPGQRGRIHRHARQEEVYLVLDGTLTVIAEGEPTDVPTGGLLRVAPTVRRQIANLGPGRTLVVALGGAEPHDGRDGVAFADWSDTTGGPPQGIPMPDDLPADELRGA